MIILLDVLRTTLGFIAALVLAGGGLVAAYLLSCWLLPRADAVGRVTATLACGLWLAEAGFHVLASLGRFDLISAVIALPALCLLLHRAARRRLDVRAALRHDTAAWLRWFRWRRRERWPPMAFFFAVFACAIVVRAVVMPVLGWDTLVYHAVRPAVWVQTGRYESWNPPGGWSIFRLHPAASEVLVAWAMLPFHSDLLAGVDGFVWLALGFAVFSLGRALGLREPRASVAAGCVLAVPTTRMLVGSGYVELALSLAAVLCLIFAVRYFRSGRGGDLVLTLAMAGVLAACKTTMLAPAGLVAVAVLAAAAFRRDTRRARPFLLGVAAAGAAYLPWLVRNTILSGYPLSPAPLRIGPLVLGRSNQAIAMLSALVAGLPDRDWRRELGIVQALFAPPGVHDVGFGALTVVPLLAAVPGVIALFRKRWATALLVCAFCATFLALYFSRSLLHIRVIWTVNSARFLLPIICVAVPAGLVWCRRGSGLSRAYLGVVCGVTAYHLIWFAVSGWSSHDAQGVLGTVALVAAGWGAVALARGRTRRLGVGLVSALLVILALDGYKRAYRYEAVRDDGVFDGTNRYWLAGARALDQRQSRSHIAVTSGPESGGDWFAYYFLGARFQNTIGYVSPDASDQPRQFTYRDRNETGASYADWVARLEAGAFTHVVSFRPPALELLWMEGHPQRFARIDGTPGVWGLFAFMRSGDDSPAQH
jgi:hypothetical protein